MNFTRSLAFLPLLAALACSSSSSGGGNDGGGTAPCNSDPWTCPAAQTCWPTSGTAFACLNAGPGKLGDACQDTVGVPTCGAGLWCLQSTSTRGTCVAFCSTTDTSHACTGGALCEPAELGGAGGPLVNVCAPVAPASDGGAEGGGGDAGTSGGDAAKD